MDVQALPILALRIEVAVCQSPDWAGSEHMFSSVKRVNGGTAEGRNCPHRTCRRHRKGAEFPESL